MPNTNHAVIAEEVRLRQRQDHIETRVNGLTGRPMSNSESALARDYQEAYDEVYRDLSMTGAPPPRLDSESVEGYRRRLAQGLQHFSPRAEGVKLSAIPRDALPHFEKMILADAQALANDRAWSPKPNQLRELRKKNDRGVGEIIEFAGDPKVTWSMFMGPVRYLTSWEGRQRRDR